MLCYSPPRGSRSMEFLLGLILSRERPRRWRPVKRTGKGWELNGGELKSSVPLAFGIWSRWLQSLDKGACLADERAHGDELPQTAPAEDCLPPWGTLRPLLSPNGEFQCAARSSWLAATLGFPQSSCWWLKTKARQKFLACHEMCCSGLAKQAAGLSLTASARPFEGILPRKGFFPLDYSKITLGNGHDWLNFFSWSNCLHKVMKLPIACQAQSRDFLGGKVK